VVRTGTHWLRTLLRSSRKQQKAVARAVERFITPAPPPKPRASRSPAPALADSANARTRKRAREYTPPATGKWMASHHSEVAGGVLRRMSYWLYLPDAVAGPLPLLVMLHGCEQSATQFAQGTGMNLLAEKAGMAVLYPQQGASQHPQRCWKWYDRTVQQGGGDAHMVVSVVQRVLERYPVDPSRVYICGLSAGAGMACAVALNYPHLFAGLGVHSGPVFGARGPAGALAAMRHGAAAHSEGAIESLLLRQPGFPGMPTILVQGSEDTVVRPVNQDQLARQAMLYNGVADGCRMEVQHVPARRGFKAIAIRDVYSGGTLVLRVAQVQGLGHAWSGGDARLAYNAAGGPNAGRMMLEFFARHRRAPLH
jgi:poly(hydroxyalkanoate) depolymerase family esterase